MILARSFRHGILPYGHNNGILAERRIRYEYQRVGTYRGPWSRGRSCRDLMMPKNNPTRRLAAKAANKMEDAACKLTNTVSEKMTSMDM